MKPPDLQAVGGDAPDLEAAHVVDQLEAIAANDGSRPGKKWGQLTESGKAWILHSWLTGNWIDLPHFCSEHALDLVTVREAFRSRGALAIRQHNVEMKAALVEEWREQQLKSAHRTGSKIDETANLALHNIQSILLSGNTDLGTLLTVLDKMGMNRRRAYDPLQLELASQPQDVQGAQSDIKSELIPAHLRAVIAKRKSQYGSSLVRKAQS